MGDASSSTAVACLPASDEVMFDQRDFDFDLADLLVDADTANSSSAGDSGRGSSSNVSEACSQNGTKTYTGKFLPFGLLGGRRRRMISC